MCAEKCPPQCAFSEYAVDENDALESAVGVFSLPVADLFLTLTRPTHCTLDYCEISKKQQLFIKPMYTDGLHHILEVFKRVLGPDEVY